MDTNDWRFVFKLLENIDSRVSSYATASLMQDPFIQTRGIFPTFLPMQYRYFSEGKMKISLENFQCFCSKIHCGYTLEPPH